MTNHYLYLLILSGFSTQLPLLYSIKHFPIFKRMRLVFLYFLLQSLAEIIIYLFSYLHKPNYWVAEIYTILEFGIIIYLLSQWQERAQTQRIFRWSIPVFCVIVTFFFINFWGESTLLIRIVALAGLVPATIFSIHSITTAHDTAPHLTGDFRFIFLAGLGFYYFASLVVFVFIYFQNQFILEFLVLINAATNIIHNLIFVYAINCAVRTNESH